MKRFPTSIIALITFTLLFSGCNFLYPSSTEAPPMFEAREIVTLAPESETGTIYKTYMHNGVQREYILYIPENLPENAPLVIGMHGYSSNNEIFKNNSGFDDVAEQNKFLMCYPLGTPDVYDSQPHWNARLLISTVDDVGFLTNLALDLAEEYSLDKNRIFATGFSNGGYMCYTLACERPDVFRAVAPVSGLMSSYTWDSYNPHRLNSETWLEYMPSTPIPICHIHGCADPVIPPDGSTPYITWSGGPGINETIEFWAGINECTLKETRQITENVTATYYVNPDTNAQVRYYEYNGWSHFWASKDYFVNQPSEINTQDIIWDFFSLYK